MHSNLLGDFWYGLSAAGNGLLVRGGQKRVEGGKTREAKQNWSHHHRKAADTKFFNRGPAAGMWLMLCESTTGKAQATGLVRLIVLLAHGDPVLSLGKCSPQSTVVRCDFATTWRKNIVLRLHIAQGRVELLDPQHRRAYLPNST